MIRLTHLIVATIISTASYSNAMNAYHDDECYSIRPMFLSISELMSESRKYGKELRSIEMRIKGDPVFGDEPEMPNAEDLRKAHWLLSWLKEKEKYIEDNYRDKCASSYISGTDYQDVKTSVSAAIKLVHQWIKSAGEESTRQWVENTNLPVFTQNDKDKYSSLFENLRVAVIFAYDSYYKSINPAQSVHNDYTYKKLSSDLLSVVPFDHNKRTRMDYISAFHKLASNPDSHKKYRGSCEMQRFDFYCREYKNAVDGYVGLVNILLNEKYKDMVDIPSPQELLDSLLGDKNARLAFNPNQEDNAANEVEQKIKNADICLKAIAHLSSNSGDINQATEYFGVVRINQTRASDKKQFLYDCKIIGNRILWRMNQPDGSMGRWRDSSYDPVVTFSISDENILIHEK